MQQPTASDAAKLLEDLKSSLIYNRRDAVEALSKLTESSPEIVRALLNAQDNDSRPEIRKLAAEALTNPAHQAIAAQYPALVADATKLRMERQVQSALEVQRASVAASKAEIRTYAIVSIVGGVLFIFSPQFGFRVMLFAIIPVGLPLGIGLIILGIITLIMTLR